MTTPEHAAAQVVLVREARHQFLVMSNYHLAWALVASARVLGDLPPLLQEAVAAIDRKRDALGWTDRVAA